MKAVIMAGGKGTRLRPLTCDLPKPMVPIVNYPVMEYIINLLKGYNITEIAITSYYLPGMIEEYFGNGKKWGVNLHYYLEEDPLGTAGSVHNVDQFLDGTFIVISGDAITDFNLQEGINFHQKNRSDATIILTRKEDPLDYGVVMTDNHGKIIRFLEKPGWGQVFSDTINTGIYILEPNIFELYQKGLNFDFSKDLFPLMLQKGKRLFGLSLNGYWNDIGSLEAYFQTQFALLEGKINLPIQACCLWDKNIWVEDGVEIDETATLEGPIYIGKGSKIGRGVALNRSIIGRNNIIQPYVSIKKSVIWDNNYIGSHAELRGTVLANNIVLQERVAIFDRTAIGRKVFVGKEARIKPGIKIWPGKEIESKVEVEKSIVWTPYWSRHLFCNQGIVGQSNIDLTPEFVVSLASAYGSTLNKDEDVIISSDSYKISNALKRALISGLQLTGNNVVDIGDTITSVARYSVVSLGAQGGIHLRLSYQDPQKSIIEFLNRHGVNIATNKQKAIEKSFFAEDYKRAILNEIGEYAYAPEMERNYLNGLLESIDCEEIKQNYFKVVLDYEYDTLGTILPVFLKMLNCQILSTRNYSRDNLPLSLKERLGVRQRVGQIMRDNYSDLGVIIDHNGEQLNLVNHQGEVLSQAQYQVLISYLLFKKGFKELFLPLNSPRVIETMAEDYQAQVRYTKLSLQAPMDKYYDKLSRERISFPYYYPYADGIAGLGLILERMARDHLNFTQLINRLPEFYLNNAEIPCDWKSKGRIMRYLSEEIDQNTELIDGIKFNHPQGWALVVPDNERAVFHVYTEGQDVEAAESLTGFYINKIKDLMKRE